MCTSFPVIVPESNKTADATCPRRKTGQTNFEPRGTHQVHRVAGKMTHKAEAIRSREKKTVIKLIKKKNAIDRSRVVDKLNRLRN